jgi:hypothetical protein
MWFLVIMIMTMLCSPFCCYEASSWASLTEHTHTHNDVVYDAKYYSSSISIICLMGHASVLYASFFYHIRFNLLCIIILYNINIYIYIYHSMTKNRLSLIKR